MAQKTASAVAEKYVRKAQAAVQDYTAGVQAVTESPTEKAAQNLDKAAIRYVEAIQSGKMARGLKRVSLSEWKLKTIEKGGARYSQGVASGKQKMEAFMTDFLPYLERAKAEIASMPSTTLEENIARMNQHTRLIAQFKRT